MVEVVLSLTPISVGERGILSERNNYDITDSL